jgi:hypothetical protein
MGLSPVAPMGSSKNRPYLSRKVIERLRKHADARLKREAGKPLSKKDKADLAILDSVLPSDSASRWLH